MTPPESAGDVVVFVLFLLLPVVSVGLLTGLYRSVRRHPGRPRVPALVAGNLLVLASLLSVFLLASECYYRFWCDTTDSFALGRMSRRWMQRHYHENASGVRDNIERYFMRKPLGLRRISFLGDSFAAGHGIADVEDRFVNRIRRQEPGWEVHVLAHLGFDTAGEINYLEQALRQDYELDQVVLVYVLNDIADLCPEFPALLARCYNNDDKPGFLIRHSYCLNVWCYRWKALHEPDLLNYYHFVLQGYQGPCWDVQKRRLAALRDLVAGNGGRLLVVTFPFLHQMGDRYEFGPVHDQLGALWRELGVPHLDLLSVYREHPRARLVLNAYDAHPGPYAHQLAADAIARFLKQNLEEKTRPPPGAAGADGPPEDRAGAKGAAGGGSPSP